MIQTDPKTDRGQALYKMYPGAITQMVKNRKEQWFQSPQYKGLQNNCKQMDQYIDNNSPATTTFMSDIVPLTIRRAYIEFSALFHKFLETDPLFSVRRNSKISEEQEHNIIAALVDNLEKTYFRERCLLWNIDHIVRYGTAITYSFAVDDYNANSLLTVKGEDGYASGDYVQQKQEGDKAVVSIPIHPLNVIMDSRANYMVQPDYMGFIGDISVASIATLLNNPSYIKENLKKVLELCKQGFPDEHWWGGPSHEKKDFSRGHSNISYLWTRLPIEGNEDDPQFYATETIGEDLVRINENTLDDNTIPIAIMRILPRQYTWYGNSPLVDKICIQNLQYWLINTRIESTMRQMDRIIFYRDGGLDVEAINSRHQTNGLVPFRGTQKLEELLYAPNIAPQGMNEAQELTELMRREDQDSSAMPNFNPQAEGGPTNKTLGGAQMMASIGELKMTFFTNGMCIGFKDIAKQQVVLLRNIVGDTIETTQGKQIPKSHLLGPVMFAVKISNVFNYIREAIDSQNRLTQLINFRATKIKQFAAIKLSQYITDWQRNSLKRESIDDYQDSNLLKQLEDAELKALLAPPPQPQPQKPSESISFKDLPPQGQVQMAAQAGIQITPPQPMGVPPQAPQAAMPQSVGATSPAPIIPGAK